MDEMLIAHAVMAFSALLPAALLELMNLNRTKDFIGYNTPKGLKSQETRKFSVNYAKKGLFWAGLGTVTTQATLYFLVGGSASVLIPSGVMTLGFIVVLIMTETQLNARFDDEGKPREMRPRY